eukprot:scaffold87985_cov39-Phaeocystis_antarctica.AAC.1
MAAAASPTAAATAAPGRGKTRSSEGRRACPPHARRALCSRLRTAAGVSTATAVAARPTAAATAAAGRGNTRSSEGRR